MNIPIKIKKVLPQVGGMALAVMMLSFPPMTVRAADESDRDSVSESEERIAQENAFHFPISLGVGSFEQFACCTSGTANGNRKLHMWSYVDARRPYSGENPRMDVYLSPEVLDMRGDGDYGLLARQACADLDWVNSAAPKRPTEVYRSNWQEKGEEGRARDTKSCAWLQIRVTDQMNIYIPSEFKKYILPDIIADKPGIFSRHPRVSKTVAEKVSALGWPPLALLFQSCALIGQIVFSGAVLVPYYNGLFRPDLVLQHEDGRQLWRALFAPKKVFKLCQGPENVEKVVEEARLFQGRCTARLICRMQELMIADRDGGKAAGYLQTPAREAYIALKKLSKYFRFEDRDWRRIIGGQLSLEQRRNLDGRSEDADMSDASSASASLESPPAGSPLIKPLESAMIVDETPVSRGGGSPEIALPAGDEDEGGLERPLLLKHEVTRTPAAISRIRSILDRLRRKRS